MKKVAEAVSNEGVDYNEPKKEVTKITYNIDDMNQVLDYLSTQKFKEVSGIIENLMTKGELS